MTTLQELCQHLLINWDIKEDEFDLDERTGTIVFKYSVRNRFCQREMDYITEDMLQIIPAGVGIWFDSIPEFIQVPDSTKQWLARWARRG
jgi:hypothetical protein